MQPEPLRPRPPREPMFNVPGIILASIAVLLAVHLFVSNLDGRAYIDVIFGYGFVPGAWSVWLWPESIEIVLERARAAPGAAESRALAIAHFALVEVQSGPWAPLSYALLHGSWSHVLLNVFWLAAFGTPVARRLGSVQFLLLCVLTALGGVAAHWLTHMYDMTPMIGASGVVSGMMGAAAWFVFSSSDRGGLIDRYAHLRPRETFSSLIRNRRTMIFFGIWFALNLLIGVSAGPLGITDGGIAWEAHIGGFLAGLAAFPLIDPLSRRQPN